MTPNLLVIIKHPSCQNEGRVIIKKFEATVRILVGKPLGRPRHKVWAEILDQGGQPVSLTREGKPFVLNGKTAALKKLRRSNVYTAEFR